jgi:hypothetical protein
LTLTIRSGYAWQPGDFGSLPVQDANRVQGLLDSGACAYGECTLDPSSPSSASIEATTPTARNDRPCRIALLYPGDREARRRSAPEESRFMPIFNALAELGAHAEPAVYHDDFSRDVGRQLASMDAVVVWVNPIHDGRDRSVLNALLRDTAAAGVFVSAHPDVIAKIGTKEVLYTTRDMGWGCDTHLYRSAAQMREALPVHLAAGARVLKRLRGHSGGGVWKVERGPRADGAGSIALRVRHAQRGSVEEYSTLDDFCRTCEPYFAEDGAVVDQMWQPRLPEGMVRCYLVHGRVEGFGLQAINALYPARAGERPESAPRPGPRLYHPPTLPAYQSLKEQLEREWVPELQCRFGIDTERLPVLWDCDFMLGPRTASGVDTYVLCEINTSSVSPFPESAVVPAAQAVLARARAAKAVKECSGEGVKR